ncbi:MAG: hypothetical protein QF692_03540 [Alphaproteobacteria bacterium]|jgi:hypothetical protein|nr:hypothetical protein [Alphaproteobacteria bacterium]MDP7222318.1 hypothetical protein [Alphaproteobacteria bacterium]
MNDNIDQERGGGVDFKGAEVIHTTAAKVQAQQKQQANQQFAERQRQLQAALAEKRRITAENLQRQRMAEEAHVKKQSVPNGHKPSGDNVRLPHYKTPGSLKKMGFTDDVINALNPQSTPIAYHSTQENAKHAAEIRREEGKNVKVIPAYKDDSRVVRGPANPDGSGPFGRGHEQGDEPEGSWHFSKQEVQQRLQDEFSSGSSGSVSAAITKILDLPKEPNYVSDGSFMPGEYNIEISFTVSGAQQIRNDTRGGVKWDNTKKL